MDGPRQGRRGPERKSSRIDLLPGFVEDRLPAGFEGLDDPREEPGDGIREDLHLLAERLLQPTDAGTTVRPASVALSDREAPSALPDDVALGVRAPLAPDDRRLGPDPPG